MTRLWGGRFNQSTDALAAKFNNSLPVDWRLAEVDVRGSIAWAQALLSARVLTFDETSQMITGLQQVLAEVASGQFVHAPGDEDVHTAVERRLTELIGPVAGKLHTGRSRNDQVATDFCLWMMEAVDGIGHSIKDLQAALVERAEMDMAVVLPGYTHLQRAQPILLSHWWLSHFWPLQRDGERFQQLKTQAGVCPLGSGALAGTPVAIDRQQLATALGFHSAAQNSLDAVSNRDFAVEFLFNSALMGVHLSRLSEALVIYSSAEFGFIELSDAYSTGSSLMPQKKNPDMLELTRGKTGTLIGKLTGLLAMLKGLPSAYDKDLQEDKEPVFEAADTVEVMLPVMAGLLRSLRINPERIRAALDPAMLATDLADYLVERGIPFREAHSLTGKVVRSALEAGTALNELPLDAFKAVHPIFDEQVYAVFDFVRSTALRAARGGTSPQAVWAQMESARGLLEK